MMTTQLIYRHVLARPETTAIEYAGSRLTYRQLWDRARSWANAVRPHLSGPHPVVGILHPRGLEVSVCHLGAWLAGAAYLPLDPVLPDGRIATLLAEAGCDAVLTIGSLAGRLPSDVLAVTAPDMVTGLGEPATEPDHSAYVIFTSGSTGLPKGVEIRHGGLATLLEWFRGSFDLRPGTRMAMVTNIMFDMMVLDEWGAFTAGATLVMATPEDLAGSDRIARFLDSAAVSHACVPTPMFERLLAAGWSPRDLRTVLTGGDRLRIWPEPDFPAAVHNAYGPTEATVLVTCSDDLRLTGERDQLPSIGRPVPAATVWLEGTDGAVISEPGEVGELMIGGDVLARGYRNAPEATRAAFDGGRRYATGDLCSWNAAGDIEYVGRRDSQVKIQGFRVELGEIEQAILREPGITQVVLLVLGDGLDRRIEAWIEGNADLTALAARLRHELPAAMVPSAFFTADALPATVNGKIDRRELLRRSAAL
ncbi:amino acid adenylation domain-containing protein [Pseudonocardiaceae bacterium YIM PH 21723]|nr:amino acid adenylation domain-containing protein [Pseudonocardiaceae bacterium YIM PH 21723]